jgi:hypothetical protein
MVELVAIKKCGKAKPGEVFTVRKGEDKILVAIKHAKYLTRDMSASVDSVYIEPIEEIEEEKIEEHAPIRRRGRPARIITEQ